MGMINISKKIRRYIFYVIIIVIVFFIIRSLTPTYDFEYFYSKDKKNVVTRIEYESILENTTYFTVGYYKDNKRPKSYIKPLYSGFTSGFELVFFWKDNKCVFNYCYGDFEVENLEERFSFRKVPVRELMKMKNDTTGKFYYEIERSLF